MDYNWKKQEENSKTSELVFTITLKEHKENTNVSVRYEDVVVVATKVDDSYYVAKFDGFLDNQFLLEENIYVTVTEGETSKTETVKVFDNSPIGDLVVD